MAPTSNTPFIYLLLGVIAGVVGFGGHLFGVPELIDLSAFLPDPLEGALIWLSRILFMPLILFFVVSTCFGKNLRNRHY